MNWSEQINSWSEQTDLNSEQIKQNIENIENQIKKINKDIYNVENEYLLAVQKQKQLAGHHFEFSSSSKVDDLKNSINILNLELQIVEKRHKSEKQRLENQKHIEEVQKIPPYNNLSHCWICGSTQHVANACYFATH